MRAWRACVMGILASTLVGTAQAQEWMAAHYDERVASFARDNAARDPASRPFVLVGDSMTEGWSFLDRIDRFLAPESRRVVERGIAGDGIGFGERGLLHRLGASIFDLNPAKVVILIGVNDLAAGGSNVNAVARKHAELLAAIRERAPGLPLVVASLPPTRERYGVYNAAIVAINPLLEANARAAGAEFLDLHGAFVNGEGELPAEMTSDGLHFSDLGYEVLGQLILPLLEDEELPAPPKSYIATTASSLNVRDAIWGNILTAVPAGTVFELLGEQDGWMEVDYQGRSAWLSARYATPAEAPRWEPATAPPSAPDAPPAPAAAPMVETTANSLNVRDAIWGNILVAVPAGTRFEVVGFQDGWVEVKYGARTAWVSGRYTRSSGIRSDGMTGVLGGN